MRVTWIQCEGARRRPRDDGVCARWTGTVTLEALVSLLTTTQHVRLPEPFTLGSRLLRIQRLADDVVALTIDLAVPFEDKDMLDDLRHVTWDVQMGRAVLRGLRVTGMGSDVSAGAATASASPPPEHSGTGGLVMVEPPRAPALGGLDALLDGLPHELYIAESGAIGLPATLAPARSDGNAKATQTGAGTGSGTVTTRNADADATAAVVPGLRQQHMMHGLNNKGVLFERCYARVALVEDVAQLPSDAIASAVLAGIAPQAPAYWPGDTNKLHVYRHGTAVAGFVPHTCLGVNVFGPVNPAHDMLQWRTWEEHNPWCPDHPLPANTAVSHMPPVHAVLAKMYECLRLPPLSEEELALRRALATAAPDVVCTIRNRFRELCTAPFRHPGTVHGVSTAPPLLLSDASEADAITDLGFWNRQRTPVTIRTRASASLVAPRSADGRYHLDGVTPSMSIRFLDILTPGTWLLHMDDVVVPCMSGANDLGAFATANDGCMLTGCCPKVNGISWNQRNHVYLTYDDPVAAATNAEPEHVRFMVRGTTLVVVQDDLITPTVGFGYTCALLRTHAALSLGV